MKYIIQAEVDPETGADIEGQPERVQELVSAWQALNPIGMYFSLTRRCMTVIVEAPNEDAFYEQLHASWVLLNDYPDVYPVVSVEEFPEVLRRGGVIP